MWNKPLRNFCVTGVTALLVAAAANAWTSSSATPTDAQMIARAEALRQQELRERVLELPEDAGVWHTIVVYPDRAPDNAASRKLAAALASENRLRSLVAQTKTHVYSLSDPLWTGRLQKHYGTTAPAIIVQRPDGRVCYKASGANLPSDAGQLGDDISAAIANCCPRPKPAPQPSPTPAPAPAIPDLSPRTPAPADDEQRVLWMIAVPMLAGALGLYQEWKQSNA